MDSDDFTDITVAQFNTLKGSGASQSQRNMADGLPDASMLKGMAVRGSKAQNDRDGTRHKMRRTDRTDPDGSIKEVNP